MPLDLTLQTKEQHLLKIKGELDGLGFERLLILRLELEWRGEMIEVSSGARVAHKSSFVVLTHGPPIFYALAFRTLPTRPMQYH